MAKTANEEILDATVRHQIKLLRFSQGEANKAASILAESDAELMAMIQAGNLTEAGEARLRAMLADAAKDAQVSLRQIEARQQGPDHPILWNVPETDYLKFYLFQIV